MILYQPAIPFIREIGARGRVLWLRAMGGAFSRRSKRFEWLKRLGFDKLALTPSTKAQRHPEEDRRMSMPEGTF